MDKDIQLAITTLDNAIKILTQQRANILANTTLFGRLRLNDWIIQKYSNTYFQVGIIDETERTVELHRPNGKVIATAKAINEQYRFGEKWEIEQHSIFLENKAIAKEKVILPEFYMITVKGERGSTIRHESFEIASKEAMRLATKTNHRTHILGVVGIVEPTVVQEPKTEYKLIKL